MKIVVHGGKSKMCYPKGHDCGPHGHHTHRGVGHHSWGCCCASGSPPRRFPTREEAIAQLEEYLKNLQAEAKGVQERIAELRKGEA